MISQQPGLEKSKFNRILVPIDFSEASLKALPVARQMARASNECDLHLLHVKDRSVAWAHAGGTITPEAATPMLPTIEDLQARLDQMRISSANENSSATRTVVEGSPADAIVRYSNDHHIDLIVMTTHGRTGLTRMLMGSVAEAVVRTANCPVVTLRVGDAQ